MQRTLAEHIQALEGKLRALTSEMMEENDSHRRNQLESELRAVDSALTHYRSGFDIESRLSLRANPTRTEYSSEETT